MSLTQKDAPAFGHGAENGHCCGLTKREYFAAQAMRGAIEWHGYHEDPRKTNCANIAKDCVAMADALIAELNK